MRKTGKNDANKKAAVRAVLPAEEHKDVAEAKTREGSRTCLRGLVFRPRGHGRVIVSFLLCGFSWTNARVNSQFAQFDFSVETRFTVCKRAAQKTANRAAEAGPRARVRPKTACL